MKAALVAVVIGVRQAGGIAHSNGQSGILSRSECKITNEKSRNIASPSRTRGAICRPGNRYIRQTGDGAVSR